MAAEVVTERLESQATPGPDSKSSRNHNAEKNGSGSEKRRATKGQDTASNPRFFLTKRGSNGKPELGEELADENAALIEALKIGATFAIVTEWEPTVDNSVEGRPSIGKQTVSRGEMNSL